MSHARVFNKEIDFYLSIFDSIYIFPVRNDWILRVQLFFN